MKKMFILVLAMALVLSLFTACGGSGSRSLESNVVQGSQTGQVNMMGNMSGNSSNGGHAAI